MLHAVIWHGVLIFALSLCGKNPYPELQICDCCCGRGESTALSPKTHKIYRFAVGPVRCVVVIFATRSSAVPGVAHELSGVPEGFKFWLWTRSGHGPQP
jgi:hypothetical protein